MKKHIMLDLETMGNSSNAAIVSIGAVVFDPTTGDLGKEFECHIDLESAEKYGKIDGSTVKWWLQQSEEARKETFGKPDVSIGYALHQLNDWLTSIGKPKELAVWGNGAGFDNVILMNAYKATGVIPRFVHWNDLDVRTIVEMGKSILQIDPKKTMVRQGTHHSALNDAKFQAQYVSEIWMNFAEGDQ
ncbi:3'-5' exonuclease [Vibrio algicola]|uniref:3'-5' exoribonuclease n=1 Tax=Vibrio algicola TaxID=2662262 RepID=A0A5Q0TFP5_9VIBR|nr:3'-5' exonuclease [Vibrio algicola]